MNYIGYTTQRPENRFSHHKAYLNKGTHGNKALQADWNKYGKSAFSFEVIAEVPDAKCKSRIESSYIDFYSPNLYNKMKVWFV